MKNFITILLILMIVITSAPSFAKSDYDIDKVTADTASYIYKTVTNPHFGSVGGEWTIIGLARSGAEVPDEYYERYYENVEEYVKKCDGILHDKKYTEYSRLILSLTAIGKNPRDVAGYNLITPLGDFEKTVWQGVNGAIWALIALDSGKYDIPQNPDVNVNATREMYVNHILEKQTSDGGWALSGDDADPDVTGMALQALAEYKNDERVKTAIDKALEAVSEAQDDKGGFSSFGTSNSESCVQMLVALCELGISVDDPRFVKNGNTILDNLMNYYNPGNGFVHDEGDSDSNFMATEQALYGIAAVKRAKDGNPGLYDMTDVISFSENNNPEWSLKNKHPDVQKTNPAATEKSFADITGHKYSTAIEALASRGIINGKTQTNFEPDSTMTRAEFATIVTRGLGLVQKDIAMFDDVGKSDWFFGYVGCAYDYGIVKGVSERSFNPDGTIKREEAAVMIARAGELCGMDTQMNTLEVRDILSQFFDYVKASDWAMESLAFCYSEGILSDEALDIEPQEEITRAEIASMLYNMLSKSKLL